MKKNGKRFVALVIVFASIMSFLPIKFGLNGQAANAVTSQIQVSGVTDSTDDNIVITNGEYSTKQLYKSFSLGVENKIVQQNTIKPGQTGVTKQQVRLKSIDGIQISGTDTTTDNNKLKDIRVSIGENNVLNSKNNTIGVTITGLPYGVNIIEYQIVETTVTNNGSYVTDSNNNKVEVPDYQTNETCYPSSDSVEKITIQHANEFVQSQIDKMSFNAYTGGTKTTYDANKDLKDSIAPFLFTTDEVKADTNSPLRFNYVITEAVKTLQYTMHFKNTSVGEAKVIKNGVDDTGNVVAQGNSISGYLTNLGSADLILVSIIDNNQNVLGTYCIQLKYTTINSTYDYTLRDAGITKLNYTADDSVQAYIDKEFTVKTESGITTYYGTMTIDKMAGMISMAPTLGRSLTDTAYKISNYYDGGSVEPKLIDGKQYIDFAKGVNNVLWLDVYEGKNGNVTGSTPLARYKFAVTLKEGTSSTVDFKFNNSILTQPGRSKSEGIDFNADRRTYGLYFTDDSSTSVSVTLNKPETYQANNGPRREFIKAWGGTSAQSDSVTEITNITKGSTIDVDVATNKYKKIVLQAYYDQIEYENNDPTKPKTTSYPIGQKYTFYIAKYADIPDSGDNTNTLSSDASLSNIVAKNENIKSTDGTSGFSSDKNDYTVKVPKADTSAGITVIATNSNVKDITATNVETGDEYGLTSGELFNFTLNTSGTTNIKVVVTAQDGITSKTYNITITNDTRSASALLRNVVTDNGDFTFDADADPNKIRVDQTINKLKVSPVPEDSKSKITVNGEQYSGTPITIDLAGSQETDMEIVVTSEDGSDSKTYNFEIYRTDSPIDNNNNNNTDVFYDDIDDCWVDTSKYEEWGTIKGKSVYFNNKGRQVKNQWINTKNIWYYLDSNGYKTTGWRKDIGGKSYYLDPTTGELKTGWININNKWYYLGKNGVMQKGWLSSNGKWYYFTPEGVMVVNQSMFIDDKTYNFGQDGAVY